MNKYEKLIEHIINDDNDKARALFHQIVVEKSREIYESLMDEEYTEEDIHSGNQVDTMMDEIQADDDMLLEYNGVNVLVDSMSWTYLQGSKIQYKESSYGSSFTIDNPNAQTTCGCGSSFSPQ